MKKIRLLAILFFLIATSTYFLKAQAVFAPVKGAVWNYFFISDIYEWNINGSVIYKRTIINNNSKLTIDISKEVSGIYLLNIKNNEQSHTYKIIKE